MTRTLQQPSALTEAHYRYLTEAAQIVAEDGQLPDTPTANWNIVLGACKALPSLTHSSVILRFVAAMSKEQSNETFWWPADEEHRNVRVLALLFAAEMVRTGDV